jgi:hypothetical protein
MKQLMRCVVLVLALSVGWGHSAKMPRPTRRSSRRSSNSQSPVSCPCPYNTDRTGRRCGGGSAYSRRGGAAPLCYEKDVTQTMVDDYRKKMK